MLIRKYIFVQTATKVDQGKGQSNPSLDEDHGTCIPVQGKVFVVMYSVERIIRGGWGGVRHVWKACYGIGRTGDSEGRPSSCLTSTIKTRHPTQSSRLQSPSPIFTRLVSYHMYIDQ